MLIYLLPPSEGKNIWGIDAMSSRTFAFDLPDDIAIHATPKDLKCKDKRYKEGILLNTQIHTSPVLSAIQRYCWVMYKAIGYDSMDQKTQEYFDDHTLIVSGLYGLLRPQDTIANYKLPIDAKDLRQWRGDRLTQTLIDHYAGQEITIIDLLSGAYQKLLDSNKIRESGINYYTVSFMKPDGSKYTHGVKKVKGEKLREWCDKRVDGPFWRAVIDEKLNTIQITC